MVDEIDDPCDADSVLWPDDIDGWFDSHIWYTFWGHVLFEGEALEVTTICMICGNPVASCICD